MSQALAVQTEQETGLNAARRQRVEADRLAMAHLLDAERLTTSAVMPHEPELDALFEFGLQRQLYGLAALMGTPH